MATSVFVVRCDAELMPTEEAQKTAEGMVLLPRFYYLSLRYMLVVSRTSVGEMGVVEEDW